MSSTYCVRPPAGWLTMLLCRLPEVERRNYLQLAPLPIMHKCIHILLDVALFSALDTSSGFWQIEVDERKREKTEFISHHGLYRFSRMPSGLKNAPEAFKKAIGTILASIQWQFDLFYLNDTVVFSKSRQAKSNEPGAYCGYSTRHE